MTIPQTTILRHHGPRASVFIRASIPYERFFKAIHHATAPHQLIRCGTCLFSWLNYVPGASGGARLKSFLLGLKRSDDSATKAINRSESFSTAACSHNNLQRSLSFPNMDRLCLCAGFSQPVKRRETTSTQNPSPDVSGSLSPGAERNSTI